MEKWLTSTVPGIILLGAAGSLLALVVLWALKLTPMPLKWHRKRVSRQAYMLGYAAAIIDSDETGRNLTAYLCFHIALMIIFISSFLFCTIVFVTMLIIQPQVVLTFGLFISSATAFTLIYLVYFEFEFIFRTYLFFWKGALERASKSYSHSETKRKSDSDNEQTLSI